MDESKTVKTGISRRALLAGCGGVAFTGFSRRSPAVAQETRKFPGKEIRVLTWTDATGQAAVRNILKPFEQQTGAKVIPDLTGATSEMVAKIRAAAARPQHDVVILSGVGAIELGNAGLLQKPELGMLPNLEQVLPDYRTGAGGFGVGYFLWTTGMIYNTRSFEQPPRSYRELWNPKHDKRICLPAANTINAMEVVMLAARLAAGDERKPDEGFRYLRELGPRVLLLSNSGSQLAELFRAGSLSLGATYSPLGLSDFIRKPEQSMAATLDLEEGFFPDLQYMVLPRGYRGDPEVVHAFLNFALSAPVQARMAEEVWYGPINRNTKLSEQAQNSPYVATTERVQTKGIRIDRDYLASVRPEWTRRYAEALS